MYRADLKSSIKAKNNWNLYLVSQFSHSVMSNTLQPYEPQHARPPCPSSTPRVHPNSYPLSPWCHPSISSSIVPFSCCPQSFPASWSFPMSCLSTSGGQSIPNNGVQLTPWHHSEKTDVKNTEASQMKDICFVSYYILFISLVKQL